MGIKKLGESAGCVIRRIAFWDLKAIVQIEESSYNTPWDKDQLEALLIQPEIEGWGLYIGGEIQAYAIVRYRTRHAFLETLTVHPDARRLGYATSLMKHVDQRAEQHRSRSLVLEVHESNLAAQLFYKNLGFEVTKVMHGYFDDGADAYLFSKRAYQPQTA